MMKIRSCAAVMVACSLCAAASAATVEATFNSVSPGSGGQYSLDSGANWNGTNGAGLFNWTRTGGDHTGLQGNFLAFCTELSEHISGGGSYTYTVDTVENTPTVLGGMGGAKADQIRELFGRYYTPAFTYVLGATDAAAMQMCVWEIVHEQTGSLDLSAGSAQFVSDDGGAVAVGQAMLSSIDGTGPHDFSLYSLTAPGVQDMLVPTPGSLALVGAGALALARRRR